MEKSSKLCQLQYVGYIYSSQPIFIVFKLFHVLILRETVIVTVTGESFFLSLITISTRRHCGGDIMINQIH